MVAKYALKDRVYSCKTLGPRLIPFEMLNNESLFMQIEDIAKKHIYDDYQFYTDLEKLGIYSKKDNPLQQIGRYITKK